MPRRATIAQADIARTLRAYRALGEKVEVTIQPDGGVRFRPCGLLPDDNTELANIDSTVKVRL